MTVSYMLQSFMNLSKLEGLKEIKLEGTLKDLKELFLEILADPLM